MGAIDRSYLDVCVMHFAAGALRRPAAGDVTLSAVFVLSEVGTWGGKRGLPDWALSRCSWSEHYARARVVPLWVALAVDAWSPDSATEPPPDLALVDDATATGVLVVAALSDIRRGPDLVREYLRPFARQPPNDPPP